MDRESIELCLQFLSRLDLKGVEVPAFNKVQMALQRELENAKQLENVGTRRGKEEPRRDA